MIPNYPTEQFMLKSPYTSNHFCIDGLTISELVEIALYTVQKINSYPEHLGKTVENYFHLLFPDEIKTYMINRAINYKSLGETRIEYKERSFG